jgi:hypothetical protein
MKILRYVCNWCENTQKKLESDCKTCKDSNFEHKTVPVFEYPVGTFVRLTKEAMKDFYMTDRNIDCYMKGAIEKGDMSFEGFFEDYNFNTGCIGFVTGLGATDCHVKVAHVSLTGEIRHAYYGNWDLEVVSESNIRI